MSGVIYIEFTRPKGKALPLLSYIIRAVENTKYSHVRLRWTNSMGVEIVYEASGTNVKFLGPLAQEDVKVNVIHSYPIELDKKQYKELVKLCLENAGISYGYEQLIGIALVKLFNLKRNPFARGRKSQVCSEIVGRFLQEIVNVGHELDLDIAGPKDIQYILDNLFK